MKEEQNKIISRVIDYIMVTTNKYDYESINNAMNNEKDTTQQTENVETTADKTRHTNRDHENERRVKSAYTTNRTETNDKEFHEKTDGK